MTKQFPHSKCLYGSILQLKLTAHNLLELGEWIGWTKSRLPRFLNDCDNEYQLYIQTKNQFDLSRNESDVDASYVATYLFAFAEACENLSRNRAFYYCLNSFIDQFTLCPYRTPTMKLSYKLISRHDWAMENQRPLPQRIRRT
ncbi:unnamed protein product [Didymodactylos carnosus]|uniref:Uncharacterized protein n=1 Tax=Didymodactylos carnosus TaxID=1234261 RepID=A0A813YZT2_9BILA|nr:unnamed protein product [Didymodactylos carnosus]CAF3676403.1 unnamed protein product [Didymodactylos carnosus]